MTDSGSDRSDRDAIPVEGGQPTGVRGTIVAEADRHAGSIYFFEVREAVGLFVAAREILYMRYRMPLSAQDRTDCAISAFVGAWSLC